jgi:hypothetical protein
VREVFDDFLAKYPLCYGYWMQYVSAEASVGDKADEVLDRGVAATPYSIELWLHYIERLRKNERATPDDVRKCEIPALLASACVAHAEPWLACRIVQHSPTCSSPWRCTATAGRAQLRSHRTCSSAGARPQRSGRSVPLSRS